MEAEIDWPSTLPRPDTSFGGEASFPVARTEMEDGFIRQLPLGEGGRKTWSASWEFSQEQCYFFELFFDHVLKSGTLYFNLELPRQPDEDTLTKVPVRFTARYSKRYKPHFRWVIQANMEEDPSFDQDLDPPGDVLFYLYELSGGDLDAWLEYVEDYDAFILTY